MKKTTKWIIGIACSPFILFIILSILLYLPPIQKWAVGVASDYASKETGMEISIEEVRLKFPLDLKIGNVKALKPNDSIPQRKDTVLFAQSIVCDIQLMPLFDSEIKIDALNLDKVKVNTTDFIEAARIRGDIGALRLKSDGINLRTDSVILNNIFMKDANVDVALADSVPEDTTTSENRWRIAVDKLDIENINVTLHTPGDTLAIGVGLGKADVTKGYFDLGKSEYNIKTLKISESKATYDNNLAPHVRGLDFNHLSFDAIAMSVEDAAYSEESIKVFLRHCELIEQSGLKLTRLTSLIDIDSEKICLTDFLMTTPYSNLTAKVNMDLNCLDEKNPGQLVCNVDGSFGREDLFVFMDNVPAVIRKGWPLKPLNIKGTLKGNMRHAHLVGIHVSLPTAFRFDVSGDAWNLDNYDHLTCNIDLDAATYNLSMLTPMLDPSLMKTFSIPSGIMAKGNVRIGNGSKYDADLVITEGGGKLIAKASLDTRTMAYNGRFDSKAFNVGHFVKGIGLGTINGEITAKGNGFDPMRPSTIITADAHLLGLQYAPYNIRNLDAKVRLANGKCFADITSDNEILRGNITLSALLSTKFLKATMATEIDDLDLMALHITDEPLNIGVCSHIDIESDLRESHRMEGFVSDLAIRDSSKTYRPDDIVCDILTTRDTTHAVVDCGDFHLNGDMQGGYKKVMNVADNIMKEINRQIESRTIDEMALRRQLPRGRLFLDTGNDNPFARVVSHYGYLFNHVNVDITSSPESGLNGKAYIDSLTINKDTKIDRIDLVLSSTSEMMRYKFSAHNDKNNPTATFTANLWGHMTPNGTANYLQVLDSEDKVGIALGATANVEEGGIRMSIDRSRPTILGYKEFRVNETNYIFLSNDFRVSAALDLRSADGMGLQVYTDDDNTDALQDITISLHRFELAELTRVMPFMPKVSGQLNGDFHAIQTTENLSVSSDVNFHDLEFEDYPMGNVSSEFVYIPLEDGSHYIDGVLYKDEKEVGTLIGKYNPEGKGNVDATMSLKDLPLDLVNGFIPDQIIGLNGFGNGDLKVTGSLDKLDINGEVHTSNGHIVSVPYGVDLRLDDTPIRIVNSHIVFNDYNLYAANNQPMSINGDIDFSNTENMSMNLNMIARNFMIIDSKENRRSEAYGRGYINFFGRVSGRMDQLQVRGKLEVLSKSDIYYILRDSPLTTDNRLKELVTFTDFSSDSPKEAQRPVPNGLNIDMSINIAPGTHVKCWMNTSHTNYLDIVGNGDLRMSYAGSNINITGRYTITEGEMKYSLPIIPLKTFSIAGDSYLEFTGDVMNPRLNITATEKTKSNVNVNNVNRMVEFNCGVVITKTLKDMGLEFIIDAPEEQSIHDELQQMSLEERGKLAVTMLTTGMYLTDGNTSAVTMNSALSSFLQQEINNIAGSALRTLDLSVGLENSTDEYGTMHTDYAFKFAKRFWNNRLSISVGGKISTGPDVSGQNKSFFDNVEMQYRLGDDSNQYLNVFYDRAVYDYLEGYTGRYGVGYMWKRKLRHFKDIFRFTESTEVPSLHPGSITVTNVYQRLDSISETSSNINFPNKE